MIINYFLFKKKLKIEQTIGLPGLDFFYDFIFAILHGPGRI